MTDEEKHAIEFVKSELQDEKIARNDYQSLTGLYGNLEIETVLNIIEKQTKEIEELKTEKAKRSWVHIKANGEVEPLFYVSEDKIKEKIEELEKLQKEFPNNDEIRIKIIAYKELLEKE